MAQIRTIDPDDFKPTPIKPIHVGEYLIAFVDAEMKAARAGTGEYLQLVARVEKGDYKGPQTVTGQSCGGEERGLRPDQQAQGLRCGTRGGVLVMARGQGRERTPIGWTCGQARGGLRNV
jgi:hypothetical protein